MKYFIFPLILLIILLSAHAELDQNDLDKIRLIVKDEVDKATKDSETRMKEYVNIKFESVDKRLNIKFESVDKRLIHQANLTYALIALIAIAIIPQYVFLWRSRTDEALKKQVEILTQEIEMLKKQRIQNP